MVPGQESRHKDAWLTGLTVFLVPAFLVLGYWQLTRALGGNSLSWAYVFEWPLFAGYLVYVRRRLLRERRDERPEPASRGPDQTTTGASVPANEEEDPELAAYNRYLAALEKSGQRKRW